MEYRWRFRIITGIPKEIEIPEYLIDEDIDIDDYEEDISDYLSDTTGFCHCGFDLVD